MNLAQFGAIINDNIYKLSMVFLLIDTLGQAHASSILSKAGAIFVIPFLLFSSAAGIFCDRFSKKWVLAVMKMVEVGIFCLAIFVFSIKSPFGCFFLLFLLGTHSAVFGPAKYGIIPELVESDAVPKANGMITSMTYLGIIIGTFLGSFLSQITERRYTLVMVICLTFACLGLLCALAIKRTPRQGSTRKISPLFFMEIYRTIQYCKQFRHLRLALIASAYFLFIGSFTQLSIIPYAIQSLHLPELMGGYLFLCTALGIALGAFIAGRFLKKKVNLLLPCFAGFTIFLALEALFIFSGDLPFVIVILSILGIGGGFFIVPLDSFIQLTCAKQSRGQVIGTANFLGFCGVLVSSFCLYFFSEILHLTAAQGFGLIGLFTLIFSIDFCFRLSDVVVPFIAKKFFNEALTLRNAALFNEATLKPLLILQHGNWRKFFLLSLIAPDYHFVLSDKTTTFYRLLAKLCYHLHLAPASSSELLKKAHSLQEQGYPVCIILPHILLLKEQNEERGILDFFKKRSPQKLYVDVQLPLSSGTTTTITFSEE